MAKNDWYTILETPEHFVCQKIDPDDRSPLTQTEQMGTMPQYKINKTGDKLSACECWAGQKWCRHKKIIVEFRKLDRVNSRWLYNFDKNKWLPPIQQEA